MNQNQPAESISGESMKLMIRRESVSHPILIDFHLLTNLTAGS